MPEGRAESQIVHRVLWCSAVADPPSLASAAKTCKSLRSYIYNVRGAVLLASFIIPR